MKVMVLGTKKIAFVNKEGEEIRGLKLFYGWENPEDSNLSGMETADCFLTEAKTPKKDLVVGAEVDIYYNRFGTFTTRMCEAGVNIKAMQDILGHADAETTMDIYAEATKELKCSEMINFEEYFNKQKVIQSTKN